MSGAQAAPVLRPFRAEDAARVAALEALCNPAPWRAQDLAPFADSEGSSFVQVGQVAEDAEGYPVGYAFASLVAGQGELLILGVRPGARRQGIARRLLLSLFERLRDLGADSVFLEVRRGNTAAIKLYEDLGFDSNGMRKGYYADNGEDAVLYRKEL